MPLKPLMKQPKAVSATEIAKYFIWKSHLEGKPITNKKLQKLLYYAQAWNMVFNNRPLFKEDIEAWIHGPAVKAVYDKYKQFSFNPITTSIKQEDINSLPEQELLEEVWKVYGKHDAQYLEILTHNELPWQEARADVENSENSSNVISLESMKNYYSDLLARTKK